MTRLQRTPGPLRLGVNIDHVATVRNARGSPWPDPLRAALLAEASGADLHAAAAHCTRGKCHTSSILPSRCKTFALLAPT